MKTKVINIELSAVIEQTREISISVPDYITDEVMDKWLRDPENVARLNRLTDEEGVNWEQAPGYPEVREQKAGVLYCSESDACCVAIPKDLVSSIGGCAMTCETKG